MVGLLRRAVRWLGCHPPKRTRKGKWLIVSEALHRAGVAPHLVDAVRQLEQQAAMWQAAFDHVEGALQAARTVTTRDSVGVLLEQDSTPERRQARVAADHLFRAHPRCLTQTCCD